MAIKKIRITNFKSFKDLEVELGKFDVLIGANASGKSNFIQIFKFLRDIANDGLDNAISMQGGVEYLRNKKIGQSENFSVNVISDEEFELFGKETEDAQIGIEIYGISYEFALKFKKRGTGFEIVKDRLKWKCKFVRLKKPIPGDVHTKKKEEEEKLGGGEIIFSCTDGKVEIDLDKPSGVPIKEDEIIPSFFRKELSPHSLLLETPFFFPPPLVDTFSGISIYDFDPKLPKKATPIAGKAELEGNGSNLSIVLKNIIEDKDKKRKLLNLIRESLPFVDDLDVEKSSAKSLFVKFREKYFKQPLPASLISDGTINITALIIALYFEKKPLTIIEEPESGLHPYLISKVVDMMKDASREKQIIVTTHNPEIVKYAGLENILLVSRDREGFSTISRPADKEKVKTFMKNEIGIEELYVQSLLEI